MHPRYIVRLSFFLLGCLFSSSLAAQILVRGTVSDAASGQPLIGATVIERGTSNGTVTDIDGRFELEVSSDTAVLAISYVGYEPVEVALRGRTDVDVVMQEESTLLQQVVVVGYGTQRKSDLTGAVGTVKSEELARLPVANVEQALQGKVAGVYVAPSSGEPGAGAVIRIRGTGTLNNANPLYVIDGMITSDARFINPQDVESVEVLKDASAAAIYGSRGANGVIIITTKRGKKQQGASISLNSYYGVQQVTRKIDLLNAAEFAELYNELRNQQFYPDPASLGEGTDWQDVVFRQAPMASVQLSATGGAEGVTYSLSGNYFQQDGIVEHSSFERLTFRLNTEMDLRPWLGVGVNASYATSNSQIAPGGVVLGAYRMPPVFAPRDSTGDFTDPTFFGLALGNPAADLFYKRNNHSKGNRLFGNLYADLKFLRNFTFRTNFGFDRSDGQNRFFEPKFEVSASQRNLADRLSAGVSMSRDWIWEQTLTYQNEWTNHRLTVLAGYTAEERYSEWLGGSRENFPGTADELLFLSAGNDTTQMNYGGAVDEALISYLFRVNYTLKDKYLFTASWRTDRSSRFARGNRTGHFPSFSVGWNAGYEDFIREWGLFDRLKFRFSYGVLGNQASSRPYPSTGTVVGGLYAIFGPDEALNYGATLLSLANANLKWETSRQTDVGIEIGLLDNRLEIEADWYNRLTYDIIAAVPIPDYVGSQEDPVVNTARVRNKGWDITLSWRQRGTLSWNVSATLSPLKNEVVKLAEGKNEIFAAFLQGEPATHTVVGLPIGAFYGYKVAGVFQNEEELNTLPKIGGEQVGDLRFEDLDGNGIIDGDDRTYLGSPIPKLTYGFSAGASYKGFDLAIDFVGQSGNKVYNAKETFRFAVYNWEQHFYDRWRPDKPSNTEPRITNGGHNYRVSDRFLYDGSFFRLRNVVLGYSLPASWLERANLGHFRFYVSGTNLWTSQRYTGYSPELPNASNPFEVGLDFGGYPIAKSWQFGLDVGF
ncbi:MAG: SusC/RagA family TonB-linked outer membrane protein [Saprospiraceae bacterium]|nr:MAG: SusC/RagA family TonB-linked outer membrane protein [Saprospiraceae bacterium]